MSEETNADRYVIDCHGSSVTVTDLLTETTVNTFTCPSALQSAVALAGRLNARDAAGHETPADFLTKTLPAFASRQRTESQLADLDRVEAALLADLVKARALRVELEGRLRHLGGTETGESVPEAPREGVDLMAELKAFLGVTSNAVSRPQPY